MAAFEERLARSRSRSSKMQYVRIKALSIDRTQPGGSAVAIALTQRALAEYPDEKGHVFDCLGQLGDFLREEGKKADALECYQQGIRLVEGGSVGKRRDLEIPAAELLLELNRLEEAAQWLAKAPSGYVLRDSVVRWNRARARLAKLTAGNPAPYARAALEADARATPTFGGHPSVDTSLLSDAERSELRGLLEGTKHPWRLKGLLGRK